MKKMIGVAFLFVISGSLLAKGVNYIDLTKSNLKMQKKNIYSIQPIEELVGKDINVWKVSYGREVIDRDMEGSKAGLYIETGTVKFDNANSNRDIEFGLDFLIQKKSYKILGLSPYFSGAVGIGWRNDKGNEKRTSTNINMVTFVSSLDLDSHKVPDTAVFQENTNWVSFSFGLGASVDLTKNTKLNFGYQFKAKHYNLNYRLKGSYNIINNLNSAVRYNGGSVNLEYKFN